MPNKNIISKSINEILDNLEVSVKVKCLTVTIQEHPSLFDKDEQIIANLKKSIVKALTNAKQNIRSQQKVIITLMQYRHDYKKTNPIKNLLSYKNLSIRTIFFSLFNILDLPSLIYSLRYVAERLKRQIDNLPIHLNGIKEVQV